jgi:hypothetical protein
MSKRPSAPEFAPLSPDELVDRLCVFSPGIVGDLQDIVLRALRTEDERETRFDTKAHTLLVASCLLVALLVAAAVTRGAVATSARFAVAFVLTLVAGIAAALAALRVIFVSGAYRGTNEREVLDRDELAAADKEFIDAKESEIEDRGNVRAQGRYRRFLIAHWWQMWQLHYALHQRKAQVLRSAQILFAIFLVLVALLGVTIVLGDCPNLRSYV